MAALENIEPKEVFHYFEEICRIPHGSYNEKQISDYCVAFARTHNLEVMQDTLYNVIIKKKATPGYEGVPTLILQGHLDMVCEKEKDCKIDMEKEGLSLVVKGDYVEAAGTTLGGDDGIAVAYALAVLASDTLQHPDLEVVLTVSEEVGMEGAAGIDLSGLKGKKVLNIDSEEEGVFLASCAGGARVNCRVPIAYEEKRGHEIEVTLRGLTGGHSGTEIHKGRANANVLMGRFLMELAEQLPYDLIAVDGGKKDNAIPRECKAVLLITEEIVPAFQRTLETCLMHYKREYRVTEPDMQLQLQDNGEVTHMILVAESKKNAIMLLNLLPNGVQSMSGDIQGLVETSLNLGILKTQDKYLMLSYAVRSAINSAKESIIQKIICLVTYADGTIEVTGRYPGWEYKEESKLREDMSRVYKELYGKEPVVEAIHAGVECGLLSDKIEEMDAISFGPDIENIHTTEERLCISSTQRVWELMKRIIACK